MTRSYTFRTFAVATALNAAALLGLADAAQAQQVRELFNNTNVYAVGNGIYGGQPTFNVQGVTRITEISTYHWNNGRGTAPGTITIRSMGGQSWTFATRGSSGQNNAPNVNWTANPNLNLQPGTYMVFDSSPSTWSSNQQSGGRGFTKVYGYLTQIGIGGGGSGSGGGSSSGSGSGSGGGYGFAPCAANSNPVAVVGPCVVPRGGTLNVFEVRSGIVPARLQFLANTPYSTAYNVIVTLTPAGGSHYTMTVPPQLCGPGSSTPGFKYNVFLLDSHGIRQGQIGTFTPDCR